MLKSALLLGGAHASEDQRWSLAAALFRQPRSLVASGFSMLVIAGMCWSRTGSRWYLAWGLVGCIILSIRFTLAQAFRRWSRTMSQEGWARLFTAGAITTAAVSGAGAAATIVFGQDRPAMLYMATNVVAFAGGAAVRNNSAPFAAYCQNLVALGVPGAACLLSGVPYLQVFAALMIFHLIAQFEVIAFLGRQTEWLMRTEREQKELSAQVGATCEQLEAANARLTRLSATDGLTGVANRRAFDAALRAEWSRAARDGSEISLLMLDADHFKRFNDARGHLAGDDALRRIAGALEDNTRRPMDLVARFGGEEFAVLLPATDGDGAVDVAEAMRAAVAMLAWDYPGSGPVWVTVSVGVAAARPGGAGDGSELIACADRALYAAKRSGRNRVCLARDAAPATT